MKLQLRTPSAKEFQEIKKYISEFELDDRDLEIRQFTAALRNDELVGFGRLWKHPDCTELCSLGVITPLRRKGIGKEIVSALIARSPGDLYLTCIIPEFFIPFGFSVVKEFSSSIQNKLDYCTGTLCVPEAYVAMRLQK